MWIADRHLCEEGQSRTGDGERSSVTQHLQSLSSVHELRSKQGPESSHLGLYPQASLSHCKGMTLGVGLSAQSGELVAISPSAVLGDGAVCSWPDLYPDVQGEG